uniref:Glycoside hydrolase family 71 protein n=1 Tax=Moniliophthora roreri TaxID=221103 RepID=A0A0W0F0S4_MONRR
MRTQAVLSFIFTLFMACFCAPSTSLQSAIDAQSANPKLVFAHFMIGITSNRHSTADYTPDMQLAKSIGIDAFALNIGLDPYTDTQLDLAYAAASQNSFKVFISFDFNWFHTTPAQIPDIARKIAKYANQPSQLRFMDKVFVSSFVGDGLDVDALRAQVRALGGGEIYFAPNFHPGQGDFGAVDGALNWMAWPNNGDNRAPSPGGRLVTVDDGDRQYRGALGSKGYIAPIAPWFSTHFGSEVPYSKNWVFPSDLLIYSRWVDILSMQPAPSFVELITWNDYGESHYLGPLRSKHTDDGASKWVYEMPHTPWLNLSQPFITAYKSGSTTLTPSHIPSEILVYWYRVHPKSINCDSTDHTGKPNGWDTMLDDVFVVAFLKSPGTVQINSGGTLYTADLAAGASAIQVPFKTGPQHFALVREGREVPGMSATSLREIGNVCPCGMYNFNAYVGSVPPTERDELDLDGMGQLGSGCKPFPLPSVPPQPINPTVTVRVGAIQMGAARM